ncbi:hypothetical protein LTR84_000996 [Exophiala bonariae]|uniref:Transcription factor domain-containing protein n=1 Tax=Exophiala bonariae TaxID=1690606 RepID=A0AAV9NW49_9EURO|nr:hypothetical protein LTR84_000996 [Exophiala bonariae]
MEDCCMSLARLRDVPSDQLIAPFVEIQILQRKISDAFCYHDISTCDIRGERALQITIDSFSRELDGLKKIVGSTDRNAILAQHLHFLEVWILEVALHNEVWQNSFVSARLSQPENSLSIQLSVHRTKMLWQLVAATVSFHNWCLSVENNELLHFPFSWWTELSYVVIVQVKTAFLNCGNLVTGKVQITESLEAEFRRAAEQEFMIPHLLDEYMMKLTTITTQLVDDDGSRDMVYYYGVLLKSIQSGYESRIRAEKPPTLGQFETHQKEASFSQLSHPEVRSADIEGSMPPAVNTNDAVLETGDPDISSANQLELQFDLAEPGFDEFVWDTMMDDFSFFIPNNGPSF